MGGREEEEEERCGGSIVSGSQIWRSGVGLLDGFMIDGGLMPKEFECMPAS